MARTMVAGGWVGDEVVKDGVWIENGGEDRREAEEEKEVAAAAGRVSMCKRFLQPG